MCNEIILENGGRLKYVANCHKNQNMCDKAVDNFAYIY